MRKCFCLFVIGLVAELSPVSVYGFQGQESLKQVFVREYPQASKRLQEFYTNLRMSAKRIDEAGETIETWEFCGNGDMLRWVGTMVSNTAEKGTTYAFVATPWITFRLRRMEGSNAYSIVQMTEKTSPLDYNVVSGNIRSRASAASGPYTIFDTPIVDFIQDPSFTLTDVRDVSEPNGRRVKVEWNCKNPNRRGWFLFSPGDWVLRAYEFQFPDAKATHYGSLDYHDAGGFPVLSKLEKGLVKPTGVKYNKMLTIVDNVQHGPCAEQEFTLESFGISRVHPD
jgi:hypothetical protein